MGIRKMAKVQKKLIGKKFVDFKFVNMQDPIENQMLKSTVEGQLSAADSNTIIELNSKKTSSDGGSHGSTQRQSRDLHSETTFHLLQDILSYGVKQYISNELCSVLLLLNK